MEEKEGDRERKRETSAIEREKEKGSFLSANESAKRNKRTRRQVDRLTGRFLKYFAQSQIKIRTEKSHHRRKSNISSLSLLPQFYIIY